MSKYETLARAFNKTPAHDSGTLYVLAQDALVALGQAEAATEGKVLLTPEELSRFKYGPSIEAARVILEQQGKINTALTRVKFLEDQREKWLTETEVSGARLDGQIAELRAQTLGTIAHLTELIGDEACSCGATDAVHQRGCPMEVPKKRIADAMMKG